MKNVLGKIGNYQTFLASLKGGGVYPQFGKTPNYFRFFLVKASLIQNDFSSKFCMPTPKYELKLKIIITIPYSTTFCGLSEFPLCQN